MINPELEELQARREKLEQEYKSLKREQRFVQDAVTLLEEKLKIKEQEDKQRELYRISSQNIPIQTSEVALAERCRKALEVNFGEIPMPNSFSKKEGIFKGKILKELKKRKL